MKPHLYIIRGIPGAGKTTFAKTLKDAGVIDAYYEADQYMVNDSGEYSFDRSKLGECHRIVRRNTESDLRKGLRVAVSNTTTTLRELQSLLDVAKVSSSVGQSIGVTVLRVEGSHGSIHGVPREHVSRMFNRYQTYEGKNNDS